MPAITVKIREANLATDQARWDDYVSRHPQSTFFHLMGWQHVIHRTFHYHPYSAIATQGEVVTGILPLFLVPLLPFGRALISSPFAVYGGICADDDHTASALLTHAQQTAQRLRVRYLEMRNQTPFGQMPVKDLYATFRKVIFDDPEKNMAAIPRKQRRMIRQGFKHDLVTRLGSEELLRDFYGIYTHSLRQLGTPAFPFRHFTNLLQEFGPKCRIHAVFRDDQMLAAVMTFFFKDQIIPFYGGALRNTLRYAVNDFMYWTLMCYGADEGYRVLTSAAVSKEPERLISNAIGALPPEPLTYQYHLVKQQVLPDQNPMNPRFRLAIETWKRLPEPLTRWIGPQLVKYFP